MLSSWFATQILPGLVSAASGAAFGALVAGWDKLAARILLSKIGPNIANIYNIVDPILDGSITGWKDSDVDRVVALAVEIATDGKLSAEEVNKAVRLVSERWLPQIAVKKVADGVIGEKELVIATKVRHAVETGELNKAEFIKAIKEVYMGK